MECGVILLDLFQEHIRKALWSPPLGTLAAQVTTKRCQLGNREARRLGSKGFAFGKKQKQQTDHTTHKPETMAGECPVQKDVVVRKYLELKVATAFTLCFLAVLAEPVSMSLLVVIPTSGSAKSPRRDGGLF